MNKNILPSKESLEKNKNEIYLAIGSWVCAAEMAILKKDANGLKQAQGEIENLKALYHEWRGQKNLIDIYEANKAEDELAKSNLQNELDNIIDNESKDNRIADDKLNKDLNDIDKGLSGTNG